jgi:hypothetical protein
LVSARIAGYLLAMALAAVIVILTVLIVHGDVYGHEAPSGWRYPPDCCADVHCRPIACGTIRTQLDGSADWTGLHFNPRKVRVSGDAECHVCIGYDEPARSRYGYCIFLSPVM